MFTLKIDIPIDNFTVINYYSCIGICQHDRLLFYVINTDAKGKTALYLFPPAKKRKIPEKIRISVDLHLLILSL